MPSLALVLGLLVGCGGGGSGGETVEEAATSCPGGVALSVGQEALCVVAPGADCPEALPQVHLVGGAQVCAGGALPDGAVEALAGRGLLDGGRCGGLSDFLTLVDGGRACGQDTDCRVVVGACSVGLDRCYEAVGAGVSDAALAEALEGIDPACGEGCACAGAVGRAECVEGRCAQVLSDGCPVANPAEADIDGALRCEAPGMTCGYGQECCCGECFDAIECVCGEDGLFECAPSEQCVDIVCQQSCTPDSPPVCGADLQTYDNLCARDAAGVAPLYDGACVPCQDSAECGAGRICAHGDGLCGLGEPQGVCVTTLPCGVEVACGCDGQLHENACSALEAGVDVLAVGGCEVEPGGGFVCGQGSCRAEELCLVAQGEASCRPLPQGCEPGAASCGCLTLDEGQGCLDGGGHLVVIGP